MTPASLLPRLSRGSDDLDTPASVLDYIDPYLPKVIWECAPGRGKLAQALRKKGHHVVTRPGDFFRIAPYTFDYGAIVTNPPFSMKAQFIARCRQIGAPWALLLPVTTLGVRKCQINLQGAEVMFLPKRVDFTGKRAPWFAVAWFTWGLDLGQQINFAGGLDAAH